MVLQNKNKSLTPTKSCVDVRADLNCVLLLLLLRIVREVAVGENLRLANAKRVPVRPTILPQRRATEQPKLRNTVLRFVNGCIK
uniref:Uncharacterized protein n=1 Tax=Anopheles quadriannulatus TaxID=34691 RepID=A0A182XJJ8_ANOQN